MSEEKTYDRKDLKILAYQERLNELMEQNADLRVELTILQERIKEFRAETNAPFKPEVPED